MKAVVILFLSCWILQCWGYDPGFSEVFEGVYAKYHYKEGDWCDQVKAQMGEKMSALELEEAGVDADYLDAIALEYCKKHTDAFIAIIWPTVDYSQERLIYEILGEHSIVAYRKKFTLKNNGPMAVLQTIPEKAPTIQDHFPYYFPPGSDEFHLMCFVVRSPSAEEITLSKKKCAPS